MARLQAQAIGNETNVAAGVKTIAKPVRDCLHIFDGMALINLPPKRTSSALNTLSSRLVDEFGRFKLWVYNIGAHQTGPRSLDVRLEAAPNVQRCVLNILEDLESALRSAEIADSMEQVKFILSGERNERSLKADDDCGDDLGSLLPELSAAELIDLQNPFDQRHFERAISETESDLLVEVIRDSITNLLKLSIVIQQASRPDQFARSARLLPLDPKYDVEHVQERFPKLQGEPWLAARLGKANVRRRQHFSYRTEHQAKLSSRIEETHGQSETDYTEATKLANDVSHQDLATLGQSDADSITTYDTVATKEDFSQLRVPGLPAASADGPFQCPYCCNMVDIDTQTSWKSHVYRDLHPYVCTFKNCDLKLFPTRHEWFEHELYQHRQIYNCFICEKVTGTRETMKQHLARSHAEDYHGINLTILLENCIRSYEIPDSLICPFCDDLNYVDRQTTAAEIISKYRKHVGRHMEFLALFALPRLQTEVEEAESLEDSRQNPDSHGRLDEVILLSSLEPNREGQIMLDKDDMGNNNKPATPDVAGQESGEKKKPLPTDQDNQLRPPVFPKVRRKDIALETLEYYEIPWEYDPKDSNFIVILRELTERGTDILFEHTRRLRERG